MRRIRNSILVLLAVTAILILTVLLVSLKSKGSDKQIIGTWEREVSMQLYATAAGEAWLQGAVLGDSVALSDYMEPVFIKVRLTMDKKGHWKEEVLEESVTEAKARATKALAAAFCEVMSLRLAQQGLEEQLDGRSVEAVVEESIGENITSYLEKNGPILLPTLDELQRVYGGEGSFLLEGDRLSREYTSATAQKKTLVETALVGADYLVLTATVQEASGEDVSLEYPIMYCRMTGGADEK